MNKILALLFGCVVCITLIGCTGKKEVDLESTKYITINSNDSKNSERYSYMSFYDETGEILVTKKIEGDHYLALFEHENQVFTQNQENRCVFYKLNSDLVCKSKDYQINASINPSSYQLDGEDLIVVTNMGSSWQLFLSNNKVQTIESYIYNFSIKDGKVYLITQDILKNRSYYLFTVVDFDSGEVLESTIIKNSQFYSWISSQNGFVVDNNYYFIAFNDLGIYGEEMEKYFESKGYIPGKYELLELDLETKEVTSVVTLKTNNKANFQVLPNYYGFNFWNNNFIVVFDDQKVVTVTKAGEITNQYNLELGDLRSFWVKYINDKLYTWYYESGKINVSEYSVESGYLLSRVILKNYSKKLFQDIWIIN